MGIRIRQPGFAIIRSVAIALALAAGSAPTARASGPLVDSAVRDLENDSIETREKAAETLRAWAGASPDRVLALVNADATPEQRERLIGIAREIFFATPRGALGVQFGIVRQIGVAGAEEQYEEGIPIDATVDGFDSANVLKGGDLLRSIDSCRIRTNLQCQLETISRDKGQIVQIEIEREGRPMRVSVCLGSRRDLRGAQIPSPELMEAAWKLRLGRSASVQPAPLALGAIPAQAWVEADRLSAEPVDPEAEIRRASMQRPDFQVQRVLPDGSRIAVQREGTPTADLVASGNPREKVSSGTPQSSMISMRPQQFVNAVGGENRNALLKRQQRLLEERTLIRGRIDTANRLANDPNLPREQRQIMKQTTDELEADLAIVQAQMDQIRQILRDR
ncbi:MAG: hypothetical protein KF691_03355 [Phycisphaeraceae bacterium]|nr:hypothetical protein [Phycisphaeraceae bacterium]